MGLARSLQNSGARAGAREQVGMETRSVMRRIKNRLATGRHITVEWRGDQPVLVQPGGAVQLNESAAAVLRLCDGTRTTDDIVAELTSDSNSQVLAADVRDFIDAALQRGWLVET
jgi:pyrroloquinoline quinone biosynthesis protein D